MPDFDISLLWFVGACFVTSLAGALFKPGPWYAALEKPSWVPPNWAFPVVWSILFVMIAISGWMIYRTAGWSGAMTPLIVYGVQLVLNFLWSMIFFGLKRMELALYEVGLLWLSIVAIILLFYPINALAALMMVPYLIWVTIAAALNLSMLRLNPRAVVAE